MGFNYFAYDKFVAPQIQYHCRAILQQQRRHQTMQYHIIIAFQMTNRLVCL
jgi:hypothetical protein